MHPRRASSTSCTPLANEVPILLDQPFRSQTGNTPEEKRSTLRHPGLASITQMFQDVPDSCVQHAGSTATSSNKKTSTHVRSSPSEVRGQPGYQRGLDTPIHSCSCSSDLPPAALKRSIWTLRRSFSTLRPLVPPPRVSCQVWALRAIWVALC